MLNQVQLSGTIEDEIDLRKNEMDGFETARVHLRFSQAQGPILLFCVGANTRHLARFKPGDLVTIFGRLTVSRSGAARILVDESHFLNEWREHDRSATIHRFNRLVNESGIRNARAGRVW
jgi:hypothetical protein